jgi:hypothetical protein
VLRPFCAKKFTTFSSTSVPSTRPLITRYSAILVLCTFMACTLSWEMSLAHLTALNPRGKLKDVKSDKPLTSRSAGIKAPPIVVITVGLKILFAWISSFSPALKVGQYGPNNEIGPKARWAQNYWLLLFQWLLPWLYSPLLYPL